MAKLNSIFVDCFKCRKPVEITAETKSLPTIIPGRGWAIHDECAN